MMGRAYYAIVGNRRMQEERAGGLTVYRYTPESGDLCFVEHTAGDLNIGYQFYDRDTGKLYVTDEVSSLPGQTGGGSRAASFALDAHTGHLSMLSLVRTWSDLASWLCLDPERSHMLVAHHATDSYVTKCAAGPDGELRGKTEYDDCLLDLFALEEDGRIGELLDAEHFEGIDVGGGHRRPHLHCVTISPDGRYYIVTDKGLDRLYVCRIDRENRRLVRVSETICAADSLPRYIAWHPLLPIFYLNGEGTCDVTSFRIDAEGQLTQLASCLLLPEPFYGSRGSRPVCSDILLSKDARWLFVSIRGAEYIAVLSLDEKGRMSFRNVYDCGGNNPRGLCLSPDGRFLFVTHTTSREISCWALTEGGGLRLQYRVPAALRPANMEIVEV